MKQFYAYINNEQKGPFTLDDLKTQNLISKDTYVWTEGYTDWVLANSVEDLSILFNKPEIPKISTIPPEQSKANLSEIKENTVKLHEENQNQNVINKSKIDANNNWYNKMPILIILLICCFPIGLYALWKNDNITQKIKIIVTSIFPILVIIGILAPKQPVNNVARIQENSKNNQIENQNVETEKQIEKKIVAKKKKIGDQIEIGNFMYLVNSISYKKTIGNQFTSQTADGIFLIIDLSVKNISKETRTLDGSLFELVDSNDVKYEHSAKGSTALGMSGGETIFLKQCQPNIQSSGSLVFEVPNNETVYVLKLRGGFMSSKKGEIELIE